MRTHLLQQRILRAFSRAKRLSFTALERSSGARSNHVAYHIGALVCDGLLVKGARGYALTARGQRTLTALGSSVPSETPLPTVLVAAQRGGKVAIVRRIMRPYAGRPCLPGGRLRLGETFADAAVRIASEKAGLTVDPFAIGNVAVERLAATDGLAHAFLLVVVRCRVTSANGSRAVWRLPSRLPSTMIPSDAALVRRMARLPLLAFDIPEGRKGF